LLAREGYHVETASNGAEGLQRVKDLQPPLVFLDIMMPLMNGYEVCEQVIDTGIGIALEDQARIFEKFQQVGDTLTDKPRGTGLGLAICRDIVEYHHGRLWVESQPGKGSVFTVALPIASKPALATAA
jgi:signal transduction histidine kinase